jgi:hypothetical protein
MQLKGWVDVSRPELSICLEIIMRWTKALAAWLLTSLIPIGVQAADRVEVQGRAVEIQVDQLSEPGQWIVVESAAPGAPTLSGSLRDEMTVLLPPARVARVVVVNSVPVLFNYSLKIGEPVETESFKAAVAFLEQLAPLNPVNRAKLSDMQRRSESCTVWYADVNLCEVRQWAQELLSFKDKQAPDALSAVISANLQVVGKHKADFSSMSTSLQKLQKALRVLGETDSQASIEASRGEWSLNGIAGVGTLRDLYSLVTRGTPEERRVNAAEANLVSAALGLVAHSERFDKAISYALDFCKDYQRTFERNELRDGSKVIEYDAGRGRSIEVSVVANRRFAELFPPGTQAYQDMRLGTYEINVKPKERLSLSLGAGVIYSFVRDPEFSVATGADGVLMIARKEDDYAEFDGAVVLNVTGADWKLFGVHPFVQIGVAPSSEHLAVLAGVGLQLFDKGAISLGAIYQRVQRLSPGLFEGQVIDDADALRTDHEFKTGLYLMLSFNL